MKVNKCSNCQHLLDAATNLENEKVEPNDGDISICVYCGQIGQYSSDGSISPMREDQMYSLFKEQPDLAKQVLEIQSVFAYMRSKPSNN